MQGFQEVEQLVVVRGTFLEGVGVAELWPQLSAMAAIGAVLLAFSVRARACAAIRRS